MHTTPITSDCPTRAWPDAGLSRVRCKMVTLAPELDRAFEAAGILSDSGVVVSAGHSGADFETAAAALDGPWSSVTHLFNQMSPFHHRSPGLVGAAILSDRPCGVIVDGIHADSGCRSACLGTPGSGAVHPGDRRDAGDRAW